MSLLETIRTLLPELSKNGSSEAIFGRPLETGGVVLIPVARLVVGFLAIGQPIEKAFGGGANIEPVGVIVVKDREATLLRFDGSSSVISTLDVGGSGRDLGLWQPFGLTEEDEEEEGPDDVAHGGHGEGQGET